MVKESKTYVNSVISREKSLFIHFFFFFAAVTKDTVAELHNQISAKVDELTRKYQAKLDARDERSRMFPNTLDEEVRRQWEKSLKENPPPAQPHSPLFELFDKAWGRQFAPGMPQPPEPQGVLEQETEKQALLAGKRRNEAATDLQTLSELLAPLVTKPKANASANPTAQDGNDGTTGKV